MRLLVLALVFATGCGPSSWLPAPADAGPADAGSERDAGSEEVPDGTADACAAFAPCFNTTFIEGSTFSQFPGCAQFDSEFASVELCANAAGFVDGDAYECLSSTSWCEDMASELVQCRFSIRETLGGFGGGVTTELKAENVYTKQCGPPP